MSYNEQDNVVQPRRVIVGNCPTPKCGEVVVVLNNYEVWPLIHCRYCKEAYSTHAILNAIRYEIGGPVDG